MKRATLDMEQQLDVMMKYELSAEEFFFIEILRLATEEDAYTQYLATYFTKCKKERFPLDTLRDLQKKRIISAEYVVPEKGGEFILEDVTWEDSFINTYFKETNQAGQELYDSYPDFLQAGDRLLPAKNIVTGGYKSLEDFYFTYSKKIRHSRKNHEKVLASLEWAKEQKLLTYGMVEYVTTKKWEDHSRMRDAGELGSYTVKVNTLESI